VSRPTGATIDADLVVLGAGMAGLTAAASAAAGGARVVVVEKAAEIGGNAVLSSGYLWTTADMDAFRRRCPEGDERLGAVLVAGFPGAVEWVRSTGAEVSEQRTVVFGIGHQVDIHTYLRRCASIVESGGGLVLRSQRVEHLLADGGRVAGGRVRDGETAADVRANATILATGGFQANRHLLERQYGDDARQLLLRSVASCDGDGLRLALEVGAATAGDMSTFYGHLVAWPLHTFAPRDFLRCAVLYSDRGVLVNLDGERFTDETLMDHRNAQAAARQRHARALFVFDESIRADASRPVAPGVEGVDILSEAHRAGAHVASDPTLEGLGRRVAGWGFDGPRTAATVEDYNRRVATDPAGLDPPRRRRRNDPLRPPFHALEVRPGVTFTEGGLRVNERGGVMGPAGAIEGLYAAGADVGGIFNGGYAGGLALATVFGLAAARSVLSGAASAMSQGSA
jgi:succinate dehydrogenase/fumarate reductase flavoprotein subunit